MTDQRFTMTVPAGSSLSFTGTDGSGLDVPVIGLLHRSIDLDSRS